MDHQIDRGDAVKAVPKLLTKTRFEDLYNAGKLPSGHDFTLAPDTAETALAVASIDKSSLALKKAYQGAVTLGAVGTHQLHQPDTKIDDDAMIVCNLLDTDVQFLAMAWAAQMDGLNLKLTEGVPCPSCGIHKFTEIFFGDIIVHCRTKPAVGSEAIFPLDLSEKDAESLPKSLQPGNFSIVDPTWISSRKDVPEKQWAEPTVVAIHRAAAAMRVRSTSGGIRQPSKQAEFMKMKTRHVNAIVAAMDKVIPHFDPTLDLHCKECGEVSRIPFDLAR